MLQKVSTTKLNRLRVADLIEASDNFEMNNWCYCIAGFAHAAMGHSYLERKAAVYFDRDKYIKDAAKYLGLDSDRAFVSVAFDRTKAARFLLEYEEESYQTVSLTQVLEEVA